MSWTERTRSRDRRSPPLSSRLEFPSIVLPGKELYRRVFELYLSTSAGFADCYHVALMERLGLTEVLTFDRDFDKFAGHRWREE